MKSNKLLEKFTSVDQRNEGIGPKMFFLIRDTTDQDQQPEYLCKRNCCHQFLG
jgi:hypothetical protein